MLEDQRCGDLPSPPRRMSRTFTVSIRRANVADHAAALGHKSAGVSESIEARGAALVSSCCFPSSRRSCESSCSLDQESLDRSCLKLFSQSECAAFLAQAGYSCGVRST